MYALEEIERTEATITVKIIPMKERRYCDENGQYVIEHFMDEKKLKGIRDYGCTGEQGESGE